MEELAEQERAVRIARQDEERLRQIAIAESMADEMVREAALRHGTDGLGSGEHKKKKKNPQEDVNPNIKT